jgi:hypothetical protein
MLWQVKGDGEHSPFPFFEQKALLVSSDYSLGGFFNEQKDIKRY